MKFLITGGAGFIGGNFIRYFLKKYDNEQVVNLDKLTYAGNLASLKDLESNPSYRFIKGDIEDSDFIIELFRSEHFDVVINFAAESHVDRSIDNPSVFLTTNIQGTYNLLQASRDTKVSRFIQISTDEVYGSLGRQGLFTEESQIKPNSPYAASKASADLICRSFFKTFSFPVLITRCCNNFGPYQFPEKLIPLFITNLMEDLPVPLYGDGKNIRDWIYVEDHCRAIDAVYKNGKPGEVYNIGAWQEKTNLEITDILLKKLEKPKSLKKYVKDRLGHDLRYAIDSTKIEKECGWKPKFNFEQAILDSIKWYQENELWWRALKNKK